MFTLLFLKKSWGNYILKNAREAITYLQNNLFSWVSVKSYLSNLFNLLRDLSLTSNFIISQALKKKDFIYKSISMHVMKDNQIKHWSKRFFCGEHFCKQQQAEIDKKNGMV